jgi:carbamoyl-phosphate synthase large subunit
MEAVEVARRFVQLGFALAATRGTASALRAAGIASETVFKVNEERPNAVDLLKGGSIQLAIYTTTGAPVSPSKSQHGARRCNTAPRASPP